MSNNIDWSGRMGDTSNLSQRRAFFYTSTDSTHHILTCLVQIGHALVRAGLENTVTVHILFGGRKESNKDGGMHETAKEGARAALLSISRMPPVDHGVELTARLTRIL